MTTCKKCGAPIIWIRTTHGKWMPCNEGLVEYQVSKDEWRNADKVVTDKGEVIRCALTFEGEADGCARLPHWSSCPHAESFRT